MRPSAREPRRGRPAKRRTAALIPLVSLAALLLGGCVISETEKGPGPGDQKKDAPDGGQRR